MTLQAEPSAEQRLAPARAEAPPLFAAGAARPDPRALQLLVDVMGADRVMLGSDAPFPLGEQDIGAGVLGHAALTDTDKQRICADNARAFFGI